MSRTGVEPKPAWQSVPSAVRKASERILGAEVKRAMRVWGGYTPTPTFRLRLVDGRRAFFKAVGPASNEFSRAAHAREERVYRDLSDLIARWAPIFYGAFTIDGWHVMLLEDLGPKSVPPWTPPLTRSVARALGDFHRATLGTTLPDWLPRAEDRIGIHGLLWQGAPDSDSLRQVAALAGAQAPAASHWLDHALPALARMSRSGLEMRPSHAFLHLDVRSDNLRWVDGQLRLFDWPHVGIGLPEYDLAAFAQSVTVEGGPEPEQVVAWYAERGPLREEALDTALAAIAGFFADQAWRPEVPGLPRLRTFQRRQLRVTLSWAARRLRLPTPTWIECIER